MATPGDILGGNYDLEDEDEDIPNGPPLHNLTARDVAPLNSVLPPATFAHGNSPTSGTQYIPGVLQAWRPRSARSKVLPMPAGPDAFTMRDNNLAAVAINRSNVVDRGASDGVEMAPPHRDMKRSPSQFLPARAGRVVSSTAPAEADEPVFEPVSISDDAPEDHHGSSSSADMGEDAEAGASGDAFWEPNPTKIEKMLNVRVELKVPGIGWIGTGQAVSWRPKTPRSDRRAKLAEKSLDETEAEVADIEAKLAAARAKRDGARKVLATGSD